MNWQRIVRVAALVAVLAIYVGARFRDLTASCLWFDEIFSVHAAEHSWDSILNFVALDLIHPPLFYILLKVWIAAGGENLFWLRSFPVVFSILAILPFVLLCRELRLGFWTVTLAFFLIAVNGSLIKYAQEVRMYSMLMCMSLFSMWLFARYFRTGKGILALTLINLVLVYTHYFGWLVLLSEIFAIVLFQRIKWRPIMVMTLITAVGFAPWFIEVLYAANSGSELAQNIGWMQRPGIISLAQLALNLVEPFYYSSTTIDALSIYRVSIPLLLIAITAICVYFAKQKKLDADNVSSSYLLMIFAIVPICFAFVASWILPYSIWGTRHLVIVFVPLSVFVAKAIVNLPNLKIETFALTMLFLLIGYAFLLQSQRPVSVPIWCGFETVGREMTNRQDVPIVVFEDLAAYHLWFAFRKDGKPQKIVKVKDLSGMTEDPAYFLPRGFDGVQRVTFGGAFPPLMWLVFRFSDWNGYAPPISTFEHRGYQVVGQKMYESGGQKIFAVEMFDHDLADAQITREEAMANLDGSCKKVTGPVQCEDFAWVIVAMYEKGDRSVLDTLLGAGKWSDGALSEMLGQFYADRLSKEADLFLSKLAERSQDEQENLCGLAVAADGGGSGDDWERAVRATLESILVSRGRDGLKKPALACLDQLKKFQEQKLNQP